MIDEQRDGSETHDPWLDLLLGAIGLAERLAGGRDGAAGHPATGSSDSGDEAAALDLLLGVASLRRTLLGAAHQALAAGPPPEAPAAPARGAPAGLLR